ncbi:hypothetical protein [Brucella daejeonensis]|nr:hypothetical protein [Brucella daejeonensis]
MQVTFDGLVRALRWKALSAGETVAVQPMPSSRGGDIYQTGGAGGDRHEERRGSIAEGTV